MTGSTKLLRACKVISRTLKSYTHKTELYRLYKLFKLDTEGKKRVTKKEGLQSLWGFLRAKKSPTNVRLKRGKEPNEVRSQGLCDVRSEARAVA